MYSWFFSVLSGLVVWLNIGLAFKNSSLAFGVGFAFFVLLFMLGSIVEELKEIRKKL